MQKKWRYLPIQAAVALLIGVHFAAPGHMGIERVAGVAMIVSSICIFIGALMALRQDKSRAAKHVRQWPLQK